jgi:hypothetical protein
MTSLYLYFLFQPKPSPIPTEYPSWCSWSSKESFLPAEFHSSNSFKNNLKIIKIALSDPALFKNGKVDAPLLLLGLTYREVSRVVDLEPETPVPSHLRNSLLAIKDLDAVLALMDGIHVPSSQ